MQPREIFLGKPIVTFKNSDQTSRLIQLMTEIENQDEDGEEGEET